MWCLEGEAVRGGGLDVGAIKQQAWRRLREGCQECHGSGGIRDSQMNRLVWMCIVASCSSLLENRRRRWKDQFFDAGELLSKHGLVHFNVACCFVSQTAASIQAAL